MTAVQTTAEYVTAAVNEQFVMGNNALHILADWVEDQTGLCDLVRGLRYCGLNGKRPMAAWAEFDAEWYDRSGEEAFYWRTAAGHEAEAWGFGSEYFLSADWSVPCLFPSLVGEFIPPTRDGNKSPPVSHNGYMLKAYESPALAFAAVGRAVWINEVGWYAPARDANGSTMTCHAAPNAPYMDGCERLTGTAACGFFRERWFRDEHFNQGRDGEDRHRLYRVDCRKCLKKLCRILEKRSRDGVGTG